MSGAFLRCLLVLPLGCAGVEPRAEGPAPAPAAATAPAPAAAPARPGLLVMAHGGSDEWNRAVEEAVAPLRDKWTVEVCYGMAVSSAIEAAVGRLEAAGATEIAVVRLFVSGESWREETEYILGLRKELSHEKVHAHTSLPHHGGHGGHKMEAPRPIARGPRIERIAMSRDGIGDSPLMDRVLADRVAALSKDPASETVLVIAHGPGDDAEDQRWREGMVKRLESLRSVGRFRRIEVATLREDWPEKRKTAEQHIRSVVQEGSAAGRVIVVPFRIAGFGPYRQVLEGLTYVADGRGFLPHQNVTRWIDETAGELLR